MNKRPDLSISKSLISQSNSQFDFESLEGRTKAFSLAPLSLSEKASPRANATIGTKGSVSNGIDNWIPQPNINNTLQTMTIDSNPIRCPLGHGPIGEQPYPGGYNVNSQSSICKYGCKSNPEISIDQPYENLAQEAMEFQDIIQKETGISNEDSERRRQAILLSIKETNNYSHTLEELQIGARVAWRNAPKCSSRQHWEELQVIDGRACTSSEDMFDQCLSLLEKSIETFSTTMNILIFRHQTPNTDDGPRIWNRNLLGYAGYRNNDNNNNNVDTEESHHIDNSNINNNNNNNNNNGNKIIGDPSESGFSEVLQTEFGWETDMNTNTVPVTKSHFDTLPLLIQYNPNESPKLFTIPRQYTTPIVHLTHPRYAWFEELKLRWNSFTSMANKELIIGGLRYTTAPFTAWYSDTQVVRNLTDNNRYNITETVAIHMGLDVRTETSLWRDLATCEIGVAVLHSFRLAGIAITDHHTLLNSFFHWYSKEIEDRGYCPVDSKGILQQHHSLTTTTTTTSSSVSSISSSHSNLNEMKEYTLKPVYINNPGWEVFRGKWLNNYNTIEADKYREKIKARALSHMTAFGLTSAIVKFKTRCLPVLQEKPRVVLIYSTVSNNTKEIARNFFCEFHYFIRIILINTADSCIASISKECQQSHAILVMTSSYGSGQIPPSAQGLLTWLVSGADQMLVGKPFSVLGLGNRSFPKFCGGADVIFDAFIGAGAMSLLTDGPMKVCTVDDTEATQKLWTRLTMEALECKGIISKEILTNITRMSIIDMKDDILATIRAKNIRIPLYSVVRLSGWNHEAIDTSYKIARVVETNNLTSISHPILQLPMNIHLVLAVPCTKSDLYFEPGDQVTVLAENNSATVLEVAAGLGLDENELDDMFDLRAHPPTDKESEAETGTETGSMSSMSFIPRFLPPPNFPVPCTFRTALTHYVALDDLISHSALSSLLLMTQLPLRNNNNDNQDKNNNDNSNSDDDTVLQNVILNFPVYEQLMKERKLTWGRLFAVFPSLIGKVSTSAFFDLIPPLRPRSYSIASGPTSGPIAGSVGEGGSANHHSRLDIVVSLLSYKDRQGELVTGYCSGWLCSRVPGNTIRLKVSHVSTFRLPLNIQAPIVMVAAGTGVAPLRSMWQERYRRIQEQLHPQPGKCFLLFGCQNRENWIFQHEMEELDKKGIIHLRVAFSQDDSEEKQYVQDIIMKDEDIMSVLKHRLCVVILCGGAAMATGVSDAIIAVIGREAFHTMKEQRRIKENVFGVKPAAK